MANSQDSGALRKLRVMLPMTLIASPFNGTRVVVIRMMLLRFGLTAVDARLAG
jgi:hypothetical protein